MGPMLASKPCGETVSSLGVSVPLQVVVPRGLGIIITPITSTMVLQEYTQLENAIHLIKTVKVFFASTTSMPRGGKLHFCEISGVLGFTSRSERIQFL